MIYFQGEGKSIKEQTVSIIVAQRQAMAVTILAHAVARTAGIRAAEIKATMRDLAATLPEAIRPVEQLAEIEQSLDKIEAEAATKSEQG